MTIHLIQPAELKLSGATVWRGVTRDDSIGVGPNKSPLFVAKPESDRFVMVFSQKAIIQHRRHQKLPLQ